MLFWSRAAPNRVRGQIHIEAFMPIQSRNSSGRQADAGFTAARLMEFSERRLTQAAKAGSAHEAQLATRLLQDVPLFTRWEQSHGRMMRTVAAAPRQSAQRVQLRGVAFVTLHRKAPFEYLRDRRINGPTRRRLVSALFGPQDYAQCLVREHAAYLSAACSFMCTDSLCAEVLRDASFCESLTQYENAYTEYYRAFCDTMLQEYANQATPMKSLLPYFRQQLKIIREHLLAGAPQHSEFMDLQALYAATGDTERLPILPQP